ncbi:DUF45 domain-containing protein [Sphingobacterium sp. SRCM116780]|uniref:DUF45 domain-containing protein n=1 Tax=Sphingobacterium sp. SRCM116780 TaxID=2907623 RepID=UPI001F1F0B41|nr:DUF45 domain-containing protein [Sphingobacterium sp. SRCM116780]UIR57779.1 DUF45 domain-containing protein [Sphingobacterium sp. SRCM116780]
MIVEIAGKKYQIVMTDTKSIRIDNHQDPPILYTSANFNLTTVEQFVKNNKINTLISEEIVYADEPICIFQQNYLIKIIKNQPSNKVILKNKTVTIYCKKNSNYRTQLVLWQKQFAMNQLLDVVAYWEEKLDVLLESIALKSLSKNLYAINQSKKTITFHSKIMNLSISEMKYLIFKAIADLFRFTSESIHQYFPTAQIIQDQIAYTLQSCQQSD